MSKNVKNLVFVGTMLIPTPFLAKETNNIKELQEQEKKVDSNANLILAKEGPPTLTSENDPNVVIGFDKALKEDTDYLTKTLWYIGDQLGWLGTCIGWVGTCLYHTSTIGLEFSFGAYLVNKGFNDIDDNNKTKSSIGQLTLGAILVFDSMYRARNNVTPPKAPTYPKNPFENVSNN